MHEWIEGAQLPDLFMNGCVLLTPTDDEISYNRQCHEQGHPPGVQVNALTLKGQRQRTIFVTSRDRKSMGSSNGQQENIARGIAIAELLSVNNAFCWYVWRLTVCIHKEIKNITSTITRLLNIWISSNRGCRFW